MACGGGSSPAVKAVKDAERAELERTAATRPVREAGPVATPASAAPVVAPADEDSSTVVLVWEGISPLHQSFFVDQAAVDQLGKDLGRSIRSPANVHVSFDSNRHIGRILLRLLPNTAKGLSSEGDEAVDLNRISPVLQALARYRSRIAARYDTRVEAFHIGIESFRGFVHCRFGAAGQPPPDGTVVDPCVVINGEPQCGTADGATLRFSPSVLNQIRTCLK